MRESVPVRRREQLTQRGRGQWWYGGLSGRKAAGRELPGRGKRWGVRLQAWGKAGQMAFFGITALGPPNMFELYRHNEISAVSKEDFFAAFRMVAGGSGKVDKAQVEEVLFEALGGVETDEAMKLEFISGFASIEVPIDIELFEDVLDAFNHRFTTRPAKQYVSAAKLREDRIRHRRCDGGSHDKYHAPLTVSQEYGWGDPKENFENSEVPCGKMFCHRPSFMSYYAESMVCFEEGRDLCAGPTMKAMEL